MVERFHRQLKAALKCHLKQSTWTEALPLVMLGIQTSLKLDLGCSSAELVYGTTLCLPGAVFVATDVTQLPDPTNYVQTLKSLMNSLQPVLPRVIRKPHLHMDSALQSSTHVFIRQDGVKKSLQQPYKGPFKILLCTEKHFTVDADGRQEVISVDQLKPAYILGEDNQHTTPPIQAPSLNPKAPEFRPNSTTQTITHSG